MLQNLFTKHPYGNLQVDFIRIVSDLVEIEITIYPVEEGSELESKLLSMVAEINGTFPMLEFEPGTLMCDSLAIAALLIRSSGKEDLLGSNL